MIEADDRLLAVEEPESSELITRLFEAEGITVHTGVQVDRVEHDGTFVLTAGDLRVEAERLLVAAGRSNNLRDVGLESVGLDPDAKTVETDERMRAGDRLWAIGDITGHGRFTHVSSYQAEVAGPTSSARTDRGRLPGGEPGDLHRPGDRLRRADRGAGARAGARRPDRLRRHQRVGRGWSSRRGNEGHIKLVADADRGCWSGPPTVGRSGGDMIGWSRRPCTRRSPSHPARDALRLPHVPPNHRGRARRCGYRLGCGLSPTRRLPRRTGCRRSRAICPTTRSDKLYTPEELMAFAQEEAER